VGDDDRILSIKASAEVVEAYDRAAAAAGMSRHRWICTILDAASGRSQLPKQLMQVIEYVPPSPVRDGKW